MLTVNQTEIFQDIFNARWFSDSVFDESYCAIYKKEVKTWNAWQWNIAVVYWIIQTKIFSFSSLLIFVADVLDVLRERTTKWVIKVTSKDDS